MTVQADSRPEESVTHIPHKHWWNLLSKIFGAIRRLDIRDSQRDDIALMVDEYGAANNSGNLSVAAWTNNPVIIETILTYSSAAQAQIQIGDRVIPVPQGLTNLQGLRMIRREALPTVLTTQTPGSLFVEVMGYEIPRVTE